VPNHLEHQRIGDGPSNIVFLNGFRMRFQTWKEIYSDLVSDSSVLLFNRRGVGASSKATKAQDGTTVVNEMRSLFSHSRMNPPYVLVAHSLGGIFANLYARVHPTEVAGVVFVDAPHPLEVAEQKKNKPPLIINVANRALKTVEKLFDTFKYSEDECIEETIAQINAAGKFPDIPISVVTGTKRMPLVPAQAFEIHQQYQTELLSLSSKSTHRLCHKSGHFPQITEPRKVVEAIQVVLSEQSGNDPMHSDSRVAAQSAPVAEAQETC